MEELLGNTLYDDSDDFLCKSLGNAANALELDFSDNNNCSKVNDNDLLPESSFLLPTHNENTNAIGNVDSPNLDFLKLGSPDLEQIFMNIENENVDLHEALSDDVGVVPSINTTSKPSSDSTTFSIEDDLIVTENDFTNALQQLHDKQTHSLNPLDLLDIPIKEEPIDCLIIDSKPDNRYNKIPSATPPLQHHTTQPQRSRKQYGVKLKPQKVVNQPHHQQNHSNNANSKYGSHATKRNRHDAIQQQSRQQTQQQQPQLSNHQINTNEKILQQHLSEQIVLNNQALLQHEQQEIALLQQAIDFHQKQQQRVIATPTTVSQHHQNISQIQQKILEQHLIQNSRFSPQPQPPQLNLRNTLSHNTNGGAYNQRLNDVLTTSGIDEQTLKMFVENPHLAPVNLEIQDLIKRERKKLRNRVASSKCRKRKLEREGKLEDKVKILKEKNIELNAVANALKQQICDLKQRVMDHVSEGCHIILP
ncbi:probable serine/threonine-protein kinase mps1 [Clytia hemisphaerica]|uniref:BZIP domain-containing protein n=1 Tax=Clytia hemisphaerica TaxID=252671 RepID=A0A7M5V0X7_9CNID